MHNQVFPDALAVDLVEKLLVLEPSRRMTCTTVLQHQYFRTHPPAAGLEKLLRSLPASCFEMTVPSRPVQQQHERPGFYQKQDASVLTFDSVYDRIF